MKTPPTRSAFTPDRHFYLPAVFYGAGGALAAALVADAGVETSYTPKGCANNSLI